MWLCHCFATLMTSEVSHCGYCASSFSYLAISVERERPTAVSKQALCVWRNIKALSHNHCCRGKAISIKYSESVCVALVIQHANRICRIMLTSVVCLAPLHFSTLSHKRHDFRGKKGWLNIKYAFWFSLQLLSKTFLILRKI
jgi:hypothetical protein